MIPTVWLHGAGLSRRSWDKVAPQFDGAVCLDLPRHGTVPATSPPTVEAFADALLASLPERCAIIGHSLGGMVALELAARGWRHW